MLWWMTAALAAEPTVALVPVERPPGDLTVYVRADGQIFVADQLVDDGGLPGVVREGLLANPARLVVVAADGGVDYATLQRVVEAVRRAQPQKLALEISGMSPLGTAPPLEGKATLLGEVTESDLAELNPKRHRFPQDPDANVSSFTANTLELGEWKVGLTGIWVGFPSHVQLGTSPLLDVAGAYNGWLKAELVRTPGMDGALVAQYYHVPNWAFSFLEEASGNAFKGSGAYLGLGAVSTLKPADPWSIHLSAYWARPTVRGDVELDALPPLLFPGLDVPKTDTTLTSRVTGDLVVVNLASDLRFNLRDSVWVWGRFPVYGSARGQISANAVGANVDNLDLIVAYGAPLPFGDTYSVVAGYMASWQHFEMRVGLGWSGVPSLWLLQAFDLSYRFGGPTRREQHEIRKSFRDQKKELTDEAPVIRPADPPASPAAPKPAPEAPSPPPPR